MGELSPLTAELAAHRHRVVPPPMPWEELDAVFGRVLPHLPLFHRLGRPLRDPEGSLKRLEVMLEVAESKVGRKELGIDRLIFASFGVAAYREPPVLLCFGPAESVRQHRQSSPWDSRGAGRVRGWATATHAEMIARYTLAAAEDEHYLAAHLATCFQRWDAFLSLERPVAPDPAGVLAAAMSQPPGRDILPLTTPEARFETDIILGDILIAAFVDADYPARQGREAVEWKKTFAVLRRILENRGRPFHTWQRYQQGDDIRTAAAAFVQEWLEGGGYLP